MTNCGFVIEYETGRGLSYSSCWLWSNCPHQPVREYVVTACEIITASGPEPDVWHFIGQFKTREEARAAECQPRWNHERIMTFIDTVLLCHWPVAHPQVSD